MSAEYDELDKRIEAALRVITEHVRNKEQYTETAHSEGLTSSEAMEKWVTKLERLTAALRRLLGNR